MDWPNATPHKPGQPTREALQPMFDIIQRARGLVKDKPLELSPASQAEYARKARRLHERLQAITPSEGFTSIETLFVQHAAVSATFFKFRAILERALADEVKARLSEQDRHQKGGDHVRWVEQVQQLGALADQLFQTRQLDRADLKSRAGLENKKSKTKRFDIYKLEKGWVAKILKKVKTDKRFYLPILTMAVTGCRPSEVHKTKFFYDNGKVIVEISGSKVTDENGQPARQFSLHTNHLPADFLAVLKVVPFIQMTELKTENERQGLRTYLDRMGKKLFPKSDVIISTILFRHFMASNLKNSNWDRSSIAGALGHASERTQDKYGVRGKAKSIGPVAIDKNSVKTAREIRKAKPSAYLGSTPPQLIDKRRIGKWPKKSLSHSIGHTP